LKFAISIALARHTPATDTSELMKHGLELAKLADEGGIEMIFVPEHHGIELSTGPNPFVQLAAWAPHIKRARLGPAVLAAPYWHPLRLAGEAGMFDQLTDGRLELGIGRGAFQYEFDRMGGGLDPERGREMLGELVPLVKQLWLGEASSDKLPWSFPSATACPKPLQQPHPPIWIAARHPAVFDLAIENDCDIMGTPLMWPFAEVLTLVERLEAAVAKRPDKPRPRFMVLRDACVVDDPDGWPVAVDTLYEHARRFETLFKNMGGVHDGFAESVDLSVVTNKADYTPDAIRENLIIGTPEEAIAKLRKYEDAGVDYFLYQGISGLPPEVALRSLELFVTEVMPAFERSASRA